MKRGFDHHPFTTTCVSVSHILTQRTTELAGVQVHVEDVRPQQVGDLRRRQVGRVGTEVCDLPLSSSHGATGRQPFQTTQEVVEGGFGAFGGPAVTVDQLGGEVLRVLMSGSQQNQQHHEIHFTASDR